MCVHQNKRICGLSITASWKNRFKLLYLTRCLGFVAPKWMKNLDPHLWAPKVCLPAVFKAAPWCSQMLDAYFLLKGISEMPGSPCQALSSLSLCHSPAHENDRSWALQSDRNQACYPHVQMQQPVCDTGCETASSCSQELYFRPWKRLHEFNVCVSHQSNELLPQIKANHISCQLSSLPLIFTWVTCWGKEEAMEIATFASVWSQVLKAFLSPLHIIFDYRMQWLWIVLWIYAVLCTG